MMLLLILLFIFLSIVYWYKKKEYEDSEYYQQTHNSYWSVMADKGLFGEYSIYIYLNTLEGYKKFIFNCYLPKNNGETTEVDVIFIHESGIYVIESKNYSGWIWGNEHQQNWTQTLPKGSGKSQKTYFFNPVIQNNVHIKWLQNFFEYNISDIYSYIVFSDCCMLKNVQLISQTHHVVLQRELPYSIRCNMMQKGKILSTDRIDYIYAKLYPYTQVSDYEKQKHVRNIQTKQTTVNKSNSNTRYICPRCGGSLVVRTAKKGANIGSQFLGCSNFPNCRYTRNYY